jgi:hypothetical protein
MARMLAVDWDRHEARYVLGSTGRGKVTVHKVQSVSLVDVAERGGHPRPDLRGSLAASLAEQKVGRVPALVGVERSSIELLHFTLPPAKDNELPELVSNQAMRESQLIGEQSVLDFMPIDQDPTARRSVIAAAIPPDELSRIQQTCTAAGLKPSRLLLRPFAAASLFVRTASPSEETYLLVNRITDEVDLTIVVDRKPVFFRTVRLPEGAGEGQVAGRLLAEINRTLAAAPQTHLGGETVERVYVFGRPDDHHELIEQIRDELLLPARVFDPFDALSVAEETVPEDSGRFAPLLGMLLDEAAGSHAIDFLHPRKGPEPVNRARIAIIAAAVLAAVLLGAAYDTWSTWSGINRKNRELASKLAELRETSKTVDKLEKLVGAVEQWRAHDVIWLDELRDLSLRLPSSRDVMVLRMSLVSSPSGGGAVDLEGLMRGPDILAKLETQVRDDYRHVRSKRIQERKVDTEYTWHFQTSLSLKPRDEQHDQFRYVSHLSPEEQLAAKRAQEKPAVRAKQPAAPAKEETLAKADASNVLPQVKKATQ